MTVTFFTNYIHHHQTPVADEFYRLLGNNYTYVAMKPLPKWLEKGGYDASVDRSYVVRAYKNDFEMNKAKSLMLRSDVVIVSYGPEYELKLRQKNNKITFYYSERWLKHRWSVFDPRLLKRIFFDHYRFRKSNTFMLCASAYAASDMHKFHCYIGKTFKWGYFTKVDPQMVVETPKQDVSYSETLHTLMWCARFLKWKHPELPVKMAALLKQKGYRFKLDMYGNGPELNRIKNLVKKLGVGDVILFKGNMPNEEILRAMRQHEIFLFTSDRHEGWGAVANEAMSNGCVLVGSDKIGSIPFLIKDNENGLLFQSENLKSLTEKVEWLLMHPVERKILAKNAYNTLSKIWSPKNAVKCFLSLVEQIQKGRLNLYDKNDGPASWAY